VNVKEYIKSGVVESYVLGIATDAERTEFEQRCAEYPEIAEARDAFERALEARLIQDAVQPPAGLKEKILNTIAPAALQYGAEEVREEAPVRRMNVWRLVAAACFLGLLGVGYWAFSTAEKYKEAIARQSVAEQQLQQKNSELAAIQQDAEMMQKPGVKMAALKGTPNAPQAMTTVFWDSTTKDVYLLVNNLPQAPTEKQYQLWALLDGKPIDLGMLESKEKRLLVKMKNVQNAQAFAITLEERGRANTEKPEGQMYVLGNL
jgi:anti-sigma-K factor RskA